MATLQITQGHCVLLSESFLSLEGTHNSNHVRLPGERESQWGQPGSRLVTLTPRRLVHLRDGPLRRPSLDLGLVTPGTSTNKWVLSELMYGLYGL